MTFRLRAAGIAAAAFALGPFGLAMEIGVRVVPRAAPPAPAAVADSPVRSPLLVGVTGSDYEWLIRYPGPDGRLGTSDDVRTTQNVHLPERTPVTIRLESEDFIYTFSVPDWDVVEVAVPDLPYDLKMETGRAAEHVLKGSQMCGFAHSDLLGEIVVRPTAEFDAWLVAEER